MSFSFVSVGLRCECAQTYFLATERASASASWIPFFIVSITTVPCLQVEENRKTVSVPAFIERQTMLEHARVYLCADFFSPSSVFLVVKMCFIHIYIHGVDNTQSLSG